MSYYKGQTIKFVHKNKVQTAIITSVNTKTVTIEFNGIKGRLPIGLILSENETPSQNITVQSSSSFMVGDTVEWDHNGKKHFGKVKKVNPKSVKIVSTEGANWKIAPNFLRKATSEISTSVSIPTIMHPIKPTIAKPTYIASEISTQYSLELLLQETKKEILPIIKNIFSASEMNRFNTVKIQWGTKITYRNCGWYKTAENLIQISASFKNLPKHVIKSTIWHELLHIHFAKSQGLQAHSKEFRLYEKKYEQYPLAKEFKNAYMQYLSSLYA